MTDVSACAQVMGWTAGAIVVGAVMYPLLRLARRREWCRFVGQDPHEYKVLLLAPMMYPLYSSCPADAVTVSPGPHAHAMHTPTP